MKRIALTALAILLMASPAYAQKIKWTTKVEESVQAAQRLKTPLMFYVVGYSKDRDDNVERDQTRAFADKRVIDLSQSFICVQLSRRRYGEMLEKWRLSAHTNLEIVFTNPDGEMISDPLSAAGVANANTLAQKMSMVRTAYGEQLYQKELAPTLTNVESKPAEIKKALEQVQSFEIASADSTIISMLDREGLDPATRKLCLETLAVLSTSSGVNKLLELAASDGVALNALSKCTPVGAEQMLDYLGKDDKAKSVAVYKAMVKICHISGAKNDRFWDGPNQRVKDEEIERVTKLVKKAADRWKREHE